MEQDGQFHGMRVPAGAAGGGLRIDALPTFVSLRAGGYVFVPSRSALMYPDTP